MTAFHWNHWPSTVFLLFVLIIISVRAVDNVDTTTNGDGSSDDDNDSTTTTEPAVTVLPDLNLSQNENDVLDLKFDAGQLLNYGDKRSMNAAVSDDLTGTSIGLSKLENTGAKSKVDLLNGVFKANIDKIKEKYKKLDIVFLIDSSSSVGKTNFQSELKFVRKLLSDFLVSYNYTRTAVVTFSSMAKIVRHVDQISEPSPTNDKCSLLNYELNAIDFDGGGTFTYGALREAQDIFRFARHSSKKLIFLVTDGFSNGPSPLSIADELKQQNITIYTIGIQSGNYGELYNIASSPGELHSYLLDSFSQFESLARKALHTDYKVGETIAVDDPKMCKMLCKDEEIASGSEFCCDENAECTCETSSGHYMCLCKPGYYGSGLNGSCHVCANGTYWNGPNLCKSCPDPNHITVTELALDQSSCVCKDGFKASDNGKCEAITCPELNPPENGYFIKSQTCSQVLNSACGARCKSGYQLIGSSIRLCQENGSWSGTEAECVLKTCPALQVPYYATATCRNADLNLFFDYSPKNLTFMQNYSKDVEKFTEPMPIDTECVFKCGHGFHIVGSRNRNCLPLSKWDGLNTSCKQITCQPLPKVKFGSYEPIDCTEQKSDHGSNCTLTCEFGFDFKGGPATKVCTGKRNGYWTHKNKTPRCVDVTPPEIICPSNYSVPLHYEVNFTTIHSLQLPYVSDNSGENVTFWSKPAIKEGGIRLGVGSHTFTYVAVDGFKNKEKCKFTIDVVDRDPPVFENCEDPPVIYIGAKENRNYTFVDWFEPTAYDNSFEPVEMNKTLNFGYIDAGDYEVTYTATDKSNNSNTCTINVKVRERTCPPIITPENGHVICVKNGTHSWCEINCDIGFDMIKDEIELIDTMTVMCENREAVWNHTVPECTLIEQPESVEEIFTISLDAEALLCDDNDTKEELASEFMRTIKIHMCEGQDEDCEITSDFPECTDALADPAFADSELANKTFYTIAKRSIPDVSSQQKKSNIKIAVYARVGKRLGLWRDNATKDENVERLRTEIENLPNNEELKEKLLAYKIDVAGLKLDQIVKCNPGSISKKLTCVQCPRGTFHNETSNTCQPCSVGFFNDALGQTSCIACPPHHTTRKIQSKLQSDCKELCPPGTVAKKKFKPGQDTLYTSLKPYCRKCKPGEYNSEYNQISCLKCPPGHTSNRGAINHNDCYIPRNGCAESSCGQHGRCLRLSNELPVCICDEGWLGANCEYQVNDCVSAPCYNGGTCFAQNNTIHCRCPDHYFGQFCEQYGDPCQQSRCRNGGTCIEINGRVSCECSHGFEGEFCEKFTNFCLDQPCSNGNCVNTMNGYQCICPPGFIGKRCHLKPCDYIPCYGNALCVDVVSTVTSKNSYRCECPKGFKGVNCTEIDNPCDSNPCRNNGECEPVALRTMRQTTITAFFYNEDEYAQYTCSCQPYFYGKNCEYLITPDFVMSFEKTNVNNFIKMEGPQEDLEEISLCSWIKTNDSFNYGTILSYATENTDNMFTLTDYNGFVLYVNGSNVITDIVINDGHWHFICVIWSKENGYYQFFKDGALITSGIGLNTGNNIEGRGVLIIGQEQDALGTSFSESESFVGQISYFDIWRRALNGYEVQEFYKTCEPYKGDLYAWTDFKLKAHGNIITQSSEFCKPCPKNLSILNGDVTYEGNDAVYRCHLGYNLYGPSRRLCLRTSDWELVEPTCKLIRCGYVSSPTNGKVHITKVSYGGVATFECDDGYDLVGPTRRVCGLDSKWSESNPECSSRVYCQPIQLEPNSVVIYATEKGRLPTNVTSFRSGTLAEIQCDEGTVPSGENLITCLKDGTWDNDPPACLVEETSAEEEIVTTTEAQTTEKVVIFKPSLSQLRPDQTFWRNLHSYLFFGCSPAEKTKRSLLCDRYNSNFTDLTVLQSSMRENSFGLSITDHQLLDLFERTLASIDFPNIDINNFFYFILYQNETEVEEQFDDATENSFRLMLSFYVHALAIDVGRRQKDSSLETALNSDDTGEKIKRLLRQIVQPIFVKFLQPSNMGETDSRRPSNAIQAIIASKEREKQKEI